MTSTPTPARTGSSALGGALLTIAGALALAGFEVASWQAVAQDAPAAAGAAGPDLALACRVRGASSDPGLKSCSELGAAQRCHQEAEFRSQPSTEGTVLGIVNRSQDTVLLYWLDFTGRRRLYQTLAPGAHVEQSTFIGHNWVVTLANDRCIGIYNAAPMTIGFY